MKKVFVLLVLFLFVAPTGTVLAASDVEVVEQQLLFDPQLGRVFDDVTSSVDAGNYSAETVFRDVLSKNGYSDSGVYWGNLLPPYYVQYRYTGRYVLIPFSAYLSAQDIQQGVAEFWIRVPFVYTNNIDSLEVYEDVKSYSDSFTGDLLASVYAQGRNAIFDETGTYVRIIYPVRPGWLNLTFKIIRKDITEPFTLLLSNENYSVNNTMTFYNERHEDRNGFDYVTNTDVVIEHLPSTPAFALLFQTGLDRNGYTSLTITDENVIFLSDAVYRSDHSTNNTYPSIYLPFRSLTSVSFTITYSIDDPATSLGLVNPADGSVHRSVTTHAYYVKEYLLISCPYYIDYFAYPGFSLSSSDAIHISIQPDSSITVLAGVGKYGAKISYYYKSGMSPNTDYHIYLQLEYTDGVWNKVVEHFGISIVDMGFAWGIRIPGYTSVHIFLDTGGDVYYNGSVEELWDRILPEIYTVEDANRDAIRGAIRWLADDYLENIYRLYQKADQRFNSFLDNLIKLSKIVWRIIQAVWDYFESMFKLLVVYTLPLVMIELVAFLVKHKEARERAVVVVREQTGRVKSRRLRRSGGVEE